MVENKIPEHVAVIMDGNGRWAKERGLPRLKGHEEGAESVSAVMRACRELGVKYLTLYAFSMENWVRPKAEISGLMALLVSYLKNKEDELHENNVRLRTIGRTEDLPKPVRKELERVMEATAQYEDRHLILALSYGSREEIVNATKRIATKVSSGEMKVEDIDEDAVASCMYIPSIPDPDLLIRTSGEMRISNFLLWQISYSELYVTDVMWPDFREDKFKGAVEEYARRHRRYGDVK